MLRAVADTNIHISAFLFGGVPDEVIRAAIARKYQLLTSPVLLAELEEKLLGKFSKNREFVTRSIMTLESIASVVSTPESIHFIQEDPDDDRVLECAVAGRADYIISGDKHLLKLGSYAGIDILTPRQFLDLLTKKQ